MLTKEQKWMNRLERCLKDMPKDCELVVSLYAGSTSAISLVKIGVVSDQRDVVRIPRDNHRANEFLAKRVIGQSEGF